MSGLLSAVSIWATVLQQAFGLCNTEIAVGDLSELSLKGHYWTVREIANKHVVTGKRRSPLV